MFGKLVLASAISALAAADLRILQTTKTFPGLSCQYCVYQGYSYDIVGCWDQRTNASRVGGNTAQSFDDCFTQGYYNSTTVTYAMNSQIFAQSIACPASGNEVFAIVWNNVTNEHKQLNTSITAASIPAGVSLDKAAFIAAACSKSSECGPRGQGVTNYVMEPDERVGVWMLCQGNKTWKISLALQAQYIFVPDPESTLSGGAIAGIIIGCIIGALLLIGFAFTYYKTQSKSQLPAASSRPHNELQGDVDFSPSGGVPQDLGSGRAPLSKAEDYESAGAERV